MYRDQNLEMYLRGLRDGQNTILQALRETKGIGPILEQRIMEKAVKAAYADEIREVTA